jgi:cytochrome b561
MPKGRAKNMKELNRYTRVAIVLHWIMVPAILMQFSLGWYMVDLPKSPERSYFFALHKSIGLTIFLMAMIRLGWRLMHNPPPLPATLPHWQRESARVTHTMLYILMFLQPLSGYLSSSFSGYTTNLFGIPLPAWGWKDPVLNQLLTDFHIISSIILALLISAHILGALVHVLTPGDHIFRRIWP